MGDSLLMLTLPNSGSTWLADVIAKHTRWNRYCMEFFNPLRSPKHYATLSQNFGCELVDCYRHIAGAGDESIDSHIRDAWGAESFNFTKEVFSPFKLRAFVRHFRCFVLVREEGDTFPPKRARVWSFYEHAYYALQEAGLAEIDPGHFEQRAQIAHRILHESLLLDAYQLGVPIIRYRELFDDEGLQEKLQTAIGECDDRLLAAIKDSRRLAER